MLRSNYPRNFQAEAGIKLDAPNDEISKETPNIAANPQITLEESRIFSRGYFLSSFHFRIRWCNLGPESPSY